MIANEQIISMTKAGLKPETIIRAIEQSRTKFDTSPSALIALKKANVSDAVLDAMLAASKKTFDTMPTVGSSQSESVADILGTRDALTLMTKTLTAGGPIDKLTSVNATRMLATVTETNAGSTKTWNMERVVIYPDRIYIDSHGPAGQVAKVVITPEANYVSNGTQKQDFPYAADYRSELKFELPYVAQHMAEFNVTVDGQETVGGQICDKLRVRHESGNEQVWSIDQNGRIVRRIRRSLTGESSIENSDFRSIDGYSLPFRRRVTASNGLTEVTLSLFQINPPTYAVSAMLSESSTPEQNKRSSELSAQLPASNNNGALTIRVLEETSVPYVQELGGGPSTSCNITGGSSTTMFASIYGNNTFGNANTSTNLHLQCNSYDTTMNWPHVLNVMLVEASNGTAYVIACDRAWAWSKCVPLRVGDTFRARLTAKGIAVQAINTKGKEMEPSYSILQSRLLR
jgi:hypothetical protein